ncbi:phage terminase large subunit [Siminovitchia terrae]|uniref:phage terminase large subunit n=1 Tax=Siminovitchia terrae TaxID=1914933 RepID=UPI0028AD1448|nr:phage terminase large subunit [Siminovitchia terrae]
MVDIALGARMELARRNFFDYCNLTADDFYRWERQFLVDLADGMQAFSESEDDVLIVNIPPRHGKSRTAGKFVEWLLGNNSRLKVMTGSYNETLSTTFSKSVRNTIQEVKAQQDKIVYSDIFPRTRVKHGDGAMNLWALEGGYNNYLATSPTGTATGFGADYIIIDDLIKNAEEAFNERVLESHWEWFVNTMISRLETNGKIIIIMTRWNSNDLAGKALKELPDLGYKIKHINFKAFDNGKMLCEDILSKQEYKRKTKAMGIEIAEANYNQSPMDIKGRLYSSFKTYEDIPRDQSGSPLFDRIINYTDTADDGSDFLCSIVAGEYRGEGYILDVLYTKDGMEVTEPETADLLVNNNVNLAAFESNNGGKGFARNVGRLIWERHQTKSVIIKWFFQSKNKMARILSNGTFVMNHLYFPVNWKDKWPDYYKAMNSFQKEGKNKHDDAPDATTGIAEMISSNNPDDSPRENERPKVERPRGRRR